MGGCARGSCSRAEASLVVSCFDQSGSGRMGDGSRKVWVWVTVSWVARARARSRVVVVEELGGGWVSGSWSTGCGSEAIRVDLICSQSASVL